jgi:hypothetical protein
VSSLERLGEAGWLQDVRSEESCVNPTRRETSLVHVHEPVSARGQSDQRVPLEG